MCGIIGIISRNDVVDELYTGLYSIQHRGQDSAGLATFDDKLHIIKDRGLVRDIFDKHDLGKLTGKVGIGHVRYPTIGSEFTTDAQPFFIEYPCTLCMAHNGNLVNYDKLREETVKKYGIVPTSRCDTEIILQIFASELAKQKSYKAEDIFGALERTMGRLNGSYSVVCMTPNGLLAFRDPHAIKPLIMGQKNDSYAFASENVSLDILGYTVVRDLAPGEAVFVSKNLEVSSEIIRKEEPAHCMFEWVYFARPDSTIENRSVYEARLELGNELAKLNNVKGDVVMPVPETARPASTAFSDAVGISQREGLIKSRYVDRTFIMPTQKKREYAVKLKLNPIIREVKGKRILLVDDSLVRGTTTKRIVSALRNAGAKEVHLYFTCPPIKWPCFYGIDMAAKSELAAAKKTIDEIRRDVGADSITYQTIEGLKRAIGKPVCTACLDGKYPTPVEEKDFLEIEAQRERERNFLK